MAENIRRRTLARQMALQYLYMFDVTRGDAMENPEAFVRDGCRESGWLHNGEAEDITSFSVKLIETVVERKDTIDAWIGKTAENWTIARMPIVDRNVIRVAIAELLSGEGTPIQVVINEAIELAKKFSTEDSGTFVNGILDRVAAGIREDAAASGR